MPGHEVHFFVDRLVFGRELKDIHKSIDYPVRFFGRGHRKWFHTTKEAVWISMIKRPWDCDAALCAGLHVWVDWKCTKDRQFRRLLESEAKKDKKWRKKPWTTFSRKISGEDLLLLYWGSPISGDLEVSSKNCVKRKKRKKKTKKKDDDFLGWANFYKSLH